MRKYFITSLGLLACFTIVLVYCVISLGDSLLHVYYLDVGQGDAILVRTPENSYILIDGGPGQVILQRLGEFMPFYERTIDLLILTHPHADHIDGLIEVLKRYNVRAVYFTGVKYGYPGYALFMELIAEEEADLHFVRRGTDFRFGNIVMDNLYPFGTIQGREYANINNSSIVMRLIYGGTRFYFGGDAETEVEEELAKSGLDLSADVYKAGHHGSRTANSSILMERVEPDYAFIPCGAENKFKHPHQEALNAIRGAGARVFRADIEGTVEFVSDGADVRKV